MVGEELEKHIQEVKRSRANTRNISANTTSVKAIRPECLGNEYKYFTFLSQCKSLTWDKAV